MKKIFIVYAVIVVLIIIIAIIKFGSGISLPFGKSASATIHNQKYNLTVAQSDHDKTVGLSGKKSLSPTSGMIFVFDSKGNYAFWMKDMKFAIDMIFLNDTKVNTIYKNVQPPSPKENIASLPIYKPKGDINYVLELPAGSIDKTGLKVGDEITLQNVPKNTTKK